MGGGSVFPREHPPAHTWGFPEWLPTVAMVAVLFAITARLYAKLVIVCTSVAARPTLWAHVVAGALLTAALLVLAMLLEDDAWRMAEAQFARSGLLLGAVLMVVSMLHVALPVREQVKRDQPPTLLRRSLGSLHLIFVGACHAMALYCLAFVLTDVMGTAPINIVGICFVYVAVALFGMTGIYRSVKDEHMRLLGGYPLAVLRGHIPELTTTVYFRVFVALTVVITLGLVCVLAFTVGRDVHSIATRAGADKSALGVCATLFAVAAYVVLVSLSFVIHELASTRNAPARSDSAARRAEAGKGAGHKGHLAPRQRHDAIKMHTKRTTYTAQPRPSDARASPARPPTRSSVDRLRLGAIPEARRPAPAAPVPSPTSTTDTPASTAPPSPTVRRTDRVKNPSNATPAMRSYNSSRTGPAASSGRSSPLPGPFVQRPGAPQVPRPDELPPQQAPSESEYLAVEQSEESFAMEGRSLAQMGNSGSNMVSPPSAGTSPGSITIKFPPPPRATQAKQAPALSAPMQLSPPVMSRLTPSPEGTPGEADATPRTRARLNSEVFAAVVYKFLNANSPNSETLAGMAHDEEWEYWEQDYSGSPQAPQWRPLGPPECHTTAMLVGVGAIPKLVARGMLQKKSETWLEQYQALFTVEHPDVIETIISIKAGAESGYSVACTYKLTRDCVPVSDAEVEAFVRREIMGTLHPGKAMVFTSFHLNPANTALDWSKSQSATF